MSSTARSKNQKKVVVRTPSRQESDEEQDKFDEIPMSQASMSSSDAGLVAAVAQQMKASSEKKRKDKDKRFLLLAEKELDRTIVKKQQEFAASAQEITDLFEHFVASYASAEDDIRKIWVKIKEEQITLLNLAIQQHASSLSQSSEREKGQLKGLASVKRACDESQKLIEKLVDDV